MPLVLDNANEEQLVATFRALYEQRRAALEAEHSGKYVAIRITTGDYVVGSTRDAVMDLAEEKFGTTDFRWSKRIGTR